MFKIILIQISKFSLWDEKSKVNNNNNYNNKMQKIFLKYREFMHSSANLFDKYAYLCYFVI